MGLNTKAIHAGFEPLEHRGAVSVPIYQSATFAFPSAEEGAARFAGRSAGPVYTRLGNPTVQALEQAVAELEEGRGAVATSTGMAAVTTVLLALLKKGDHILATQPLYGASRTMMQENLARFGISSTFVRASDSAALRSEFRSETRLIYVETPANPTLDLVDLESAAALARSTGVPLVVDNTFAGPFLQRPLNMGAHVVVHSMTKSLNGHSDVIAGMIVASDPVLLDSIRQTATRLGMTADPHQAWLVLRGIRTLGMRVERAQSNAIELANWLERHPAVATVRFPGLPSHPQYELAQRQMSGPGSMISFEVRGGDEAARALLNNVHVITLAVSLGGIESLIEHPASMTHTAATPAELRAESVTPGLIRLSVGCEDLDDLRADLAQALAAAETAVGEAHLAGTPA